MSTLDAITEASRSLGEPEWLLSWRKKAFEKTATLPRGEKYGISIVGVSAETDPEFSGTSEYEVDASKGLELYTWREAVAQEEIAPILERLLRSELLPEPDSRLAAFSRSAFTSGLVVYVQPTLDEKGAHGEERLKLITQVNGSAADMLVVILKEGARLEMIDIVKGDKASVFGRTMIVLPESDAGVHVATTSESDGFNSIERFALVGPYSSAKFFEDPRSGRYRSRTMHFLLGEEASGEVLHSLVASGDAVLDIWAGVEHRASDTHSRVDALGIAADASKIVYRGVIDMKEGVRAVGGAQEGKFLILSPKAEIDAIPALDIASKEVASSHKLSVSHIRDIDLFYARSRGIPEEDAREIALEGFFAPLFQRIEKQEIIEDIRKRIHAVAAKQ